MSEVRIGYLSKYLIAEDDSDTPEFFELGEVTEINPGEETGDRVETTHFQSPDRRREYTAGMIDTGEASVSINWIPGNATDQFIRALAATGATRRHRIEFPNGATVEFDGAILSYSKTVPIDDRMTASFTVAKSGAEVWTGDEGSGS